MNPRIITAASVVVAVLGGAFGLAFTGQIPGDAALGFATSTVGAFLAILLGNEIQTARRK